MSKPEVTGSKCNAQLFELQCQKDGLAWIVTVPVPEVS